jgi:hypothetical protein
MSGQWCEHNQTPRHIRIHSIYHLRRATSWALVPALAVFLRFVSDAVLKVTIGVVLLALVGLHDVKELATQRQAGRAEIHAR